MVGRVPGAEDLIVPRVLEDGGLGFYDKKTALDEMYADLERLGHRRRRQHDMRRTLISLARADGARPDLLEWVTHGPRADIIDQYTTPPWATLCEQIACLNVSYREGRVVELQTAVAGMRSAGPSDGFGTVAAKSLITQREVGWGTRTRT